MQCTLHKAKNVNCVCPSSTICFLECSFHFCALDKGNQYLFCHISSLFVNVLCLFSFSMKYKMYLPITRSEVKPLQIDGNNNPGRGENIRTNSGGELTEYCILTWNIIPRIAFDFLFLFLYSLCQLLKHMHHLNEHLPDFRAELLVKQWLECIIKKPLPPIIKA